MKSDRVKNTLLFYLLKQKKTKKQKQKKKTKPYFYTYSSNQRV